MPKTNPKITSGRRDRQPEVGREKIEEKISKVVRIRSCTVLKKEWHIPGGHSFLKTGKCSS